MEVVELATAQGPARAHLETARVPVGALALGHGAGGGVAARDLVAASEVAASLGFTVALVEQPYRVAGRRTPPSADRLDAAWLEIIEQLRTGALDGLALVGGGRSSGARVACRTATATGSVAVLCLAFPLHPPGRAGDPAKSRLGELDAVRVPTLVVQGERDPFGMPPERPGRVVARVAGDHSLRDASGVRAAIAPWLAGVAMRR